MPSLTPIYDQVATEQGWSLDDLHPRFSMDWFLWDNRAKVAAARMLRDPDPTSAIVLPFPTAPATANQDR